MSLDAERCDRLRWDMRAFIHAEPDSQFVREVEIR
jgi:hypothetical protein